MLTSQSKRSGRDSLIIAFQSEKAKGRWGCEFRKESASEVSYLWLEQGRNRTYALGHIRQGLEVVTKTTKYAAELFDVRRHRHARQGGDFVIVRTDTISSDDVAQEVDLRGSDRVGGANAQERQLESLCN